ncbi:methylated-DNA--[protein]-cysteine S-methyltransferase [Verrucomicrobiaceae bacterium 227]
MNDYERIAKIIRHLDECSEEQPGLDDLADLVGLSSYHFHRLFTRWAGVTPKAFLGCLTIEHAKELLRKGESVLDTSYESGLSGPGRLHDLCVQLEAASPGELKTGGEGWVIRYGLAESPFGAVLIAEGPRGICHLSFEETTDGDALSAELVRNWASANFERDDSFAGELARRIFNPEGESDRARPIKAFVQGTPMQVKVWRALLKIPAGTLTTYGELAELIEHPGAARATGSAVGANPLAYLIPCHRVIRKTGVMGGYRWSTLRKQAMIGRESSGAPRNPSI